MHGYLNIRTYVFIFVPRPLQVVWTIASRRLPVAMPHNVVPILPSLPSSEIKSFWDHLSNANSPLAEISPGKNHYPIWLWGDECQYRESGEEVMLIAMGGVLDNRKHSIEACYPLSITRSEARLDFTPFVYQRWFSWSTFAIYHQSSVSKQKGSVSRIVLTQIRN